MAAGTQKLSPKSQSNKSAQLTHMPLQGLITTSFTPWMDATGNMPKSKPNKSAQQTHMLTQELITTSFTP